MRGKKKRPSCPAAESILYSGHTGRLEKLSLGKRNWRPIYRERRGGYTNDFLASRLGVRATKERDRGRTGAFL